MNKIFIDVCIGLYLFSTFWISFYGYNSLALAGLYLSSRKNQKLLKAAEDLPAMLPRVTIQLPIYNEKYVVGRLLKAVSELDYPRELLQIQVLDDSTDDTREITVKMVEAYRNAGFDMTYIHRGSRDGYKAGALEHGLNTATGEFVGIFDADFIPPRNWLKRMLPAFNDPSVGCVQSRWGHLNSNHSNFTRAVALALDGHFTVEQNARSRKQLIMGFNGSAGMWRKTCIEDAGGWSGDTLTEDLDLSYRAQMRGWRVKFIEDLVVPAELPTEVAAFKQQQYRWAKGGIQTARKLIPALLDSTLPPSSKLMGMLHLTAYSGQLLMVVILLSFLPVGLYAPGVFRVFPLTILASFGPPFLYAIARSDTCKSFWGKARLIFMVVIIGFGMSLNSSVALLDGLFSKSSGTFTRTPKLNMMGYSRKKIDRSYQVKISPMVLGEFFLAVYSLLSAYLLLPRLGFGGIFWLLFYTAGYLYISMLNIIQEWRIYRQMNGIDSPFEKRGRILDKKQSA
ncbi:MAG: glycosyltransferase [Anaerolineae bacterium]|nr:glycosyltransferase [Anaerolineae bacterium]